MTSVTRIGKLSTCCERIVYCNAVMFTDVYWNVLDCMQVPVAARSKVWVCYAGVAGSNPAGCVDVCVL